MTKANELVLIGGVIKSLKEAGSWCGETHIQKSSYVAKAVAKVPFESEFILYKHGPYSFDLNALLNNMRSQSIVVMERPGMGSSYSLNKSIWDAIDRAAGGLFEQYQSRIKLICDYLGPKNVGQLERIATSFYVREHFPDLDLDEKKQKLIGLKRHISPSQADLAFDEAESLVLELAA